MSKISGPLHTTLLLDGGREVMVPNSGIMTGTIHIARIDPAFESKLQFSLKIDWDAEQAIKAMNEEVGDYPTIFKSPLDICSSSLEGQTVELSISCEVEAARRIEAKSHLIRAAYLARTYTSLH